ncbi:hypothetical protein [Thiohalorhabdus methylotrophus]|uniref:DUF1631 family protein n=1 Tax=Thiohalorhabdus methylotrophus TaxID=3242694 RepID=A0ABV4TQ96_9GAMM
MTHSFYASGQLCPPSNCPSLTSCGTAEQAVQLLRNRLVSAAMQEPDHRLDPEALARITNAFLEELGHLKGPAYLSAMGSEGMLTNRRQLLFERIVVGRFEAFLEEVPPGLTSPEEPRISRRLLPGLFRALEDLAGTAFLEGCRERAREICEEIVTEQGSSGLWEHLAEDPRARDLVNDFVAHVAPLFTNPAQHYGLFAQRIINTLPVGEADEDPELLFSWSQYLLVIRALFSDFRAAYRRAGLEKRLELRFDPECRANIARALLALDKANKELALEKR